MKKKRENSILTVVGLLAVCVVVFLAFLGGLSNVSLSRKAEDKQRLEEAIRRSVVACYAAEGVYPANLAYLEEHYGIQINRDRYEVIYQPVTENLMPDITVVEKKG